MLCPNVVVLPCLVIYISNPCFHFTCVRIHSNKSAVHFVQHLFYGVERTHRGNVASVVVKDFHLRLLVHVIHHRVVVLVVFCHQLFIDGRVLGFFDNKIFDNVAFAIYPARVVSPLAVEILLHHPHLLKDSLLGAVLHAGVDRSVNLKSVAVEIDVVLLAPLTHFFNNSPSEVWAFRVFVGLGCIFQVKILLGAFVILLARQVVMQNGIVHNHIAALKATLRIVERIVVRCAFENSHKHGTLLNCEFVGSGVKVGLCRCFDAKRLISKVHGIGIHLKNPFLAVEGLNLTGENPLFGLHDKHFNAGNVAQQASCVFAGAHLKHVFHKLLSDGRCAAWSMMDNQVLECSAHTLEVNAPVVIEALIFGVDKKSVEH